MNKQDFIDQLREKLSGFPVRDVGERLEFYSEMIDDRIEEGLSEFEAIAAIGTVDEIASQIVAESPLAKIVKEKIKPKRSLRTWEILLLALGSPIWLSLLIAAFAVLLSLYAVLWSLIITAWAIFGALAGTAIGAMVGGMVIIIFTNTWSGLALLAVSLVCAGLSIFAFFGCLAATRGSVLLTKRIAIGIKRSFTRKEKVK